MQKVGQFLERHCQWFAIGLGVLFLGYMVWTYTPISPTPALSVTINRQTVLPGHIEETIAAKSAALEKEMDEKHPGFEIPRPDVLGAWQDHIKGTEVADSAAKIWPNPFYYPGATGVVGGGDVNNPQQNHRLTKLPIPPKAVPAVGPGGQAISIAQVRTVALVPATQPAGAAGQAAAQPNGQPAPAVETDADVVSTLFTISHADLAAAFNAAFGNLNNLPPNLATQIDETMVLHVDLIREELLPDGKTWGNQTTIPPLSIHDIMALPRQQDPPINDVNAFLPWAEAHTADILEPSYYQTRKDMPVIFSPDQPPPVNPAANQPSTPTPPTPPIPPNNRFYPPSNRPGGNNNTPRRPGGFGTGMLTPDRGASVITVQYNPEMRPPGMEPGLPWNPQAAPGLDANVINGKFDVTKLGSDIRILGHDDTVIPGHTYRYRVRYVLYNSIYGIGNIAQPPALAKQFYMTSLLSDPTPQITVPTRLRFFLANIFRGGVVFDVFTWKNGHWSKSRSQTIFPGDAVPGTDWSVLDVRDDLHGNGEKYALLLNIDGTTERHEVNQDRNNPDYQLLEDEAAKASAQASAGQNPGQ